MKKLILLSVVASLSLMASDIAAISGEIALGGGAMKDDDRLVYHGSHDKDFDKSTVFPLIMSRFSVGDFELSVGGEGLVKGLYRINGAWSIYAGYDQQETWENPFLNGNTREKTDLDTFVAGVNYQLLEWLSIGYQYKQQELENENVHADDRRSGDIHGVNVAMDYVLCDTVALRVKFDHELGSFEGKGNDYFAMGIAPSFEWKVLENTRVESEVFYTYYDFSHDMNHFNKKRDEHSYGVSLKLTQEKLFGYPDVFGFVMASHAKRESNIDFYDASTSVAALGLGYRF